MNPAVTGWIRTTEACLPLTLCGCRQRILAEDKYQTLQETTWPPIDSHTAQMKTRSLQHTDTELRPAYSHSSTNTAVAFKLIYSGRGSDKSQVI